MLVTTSIVLVTCADFSAVASNSTPVYLTNINCFGVEERLMECRHAALQNITNCNKKVGVNCSNAVNLTCKNEALRRNETTKVLYICHNGVWKTLCPTLWQSSARLALVACRQLYPNDIVICKLLVFYYNNAISSHHTYIDGNVTIVDGVFKTAKIFRYHHFCTGTERSLAHCTISGVNPKFRKQICVKNKAVGIECETGHIIILNYVL